MTRAVVVGISAILLGILIWRSGRCYDDDKYFWPSARDSGKAKQLREYIESEHRRGGPVVAAAAMLVGMHARALGSFGEAPERAKALLAALVAESLATGAPVRVELRGPSAERMAALAAQAKADFGEVAPLEEMFEGRVSWRLQYALAPVWEPVWPGLLEFDADSAGGAAMVLDCDAALSGYVYQLGAVQRRFAGILLVCRAALRVDGVGEVVVAEARSQPGETFSAEVSSLGMSVGITYTGSTAIDDDALSGMLEQALREVGDSFKRQLFGEAPAAATELLSEAARTRKWCEEESEEEACLRLAKWLLDGGEAEVTQDAAKGIALLEKACLGAGTGEACVELARRWLAEAAATGATGAELEQVRAKAWVRIENGCYLERPACWTFEAEWRLGLVQGADRRGSKADAVKLLEQACAKAYERACLRLAELK